MTFVEIVELFVFNIPSWSLTYTLTWGFESYVYGECYLPTSQGPLGLEMIALGFPNLEAPLTPLSDFKGQWFFFF